MGCGKSKQAVATADSVTKSSSRSNKSGRKSSSGGDHHHLDKSGSVGGGSNSIKHRTESQQPSPKTTSTSTTTTTTETTTTTTAAAATTNDDEIMTTTTTDKSVSHGGEAVDEMNISHPNPQVIVKQQQPGAGDVTVAVVPEVRNGMAVTTAVMVMSGGEIKDEMRKEDDDLNVNDITYKREKRHDRTVSSLSQATSEYYSEAETTDEEEVDDDDDLDEEELVRGDDEVRTNKVEESAEISDVDVKKMVDEMEEKELKVEELNGSLSEELVKKEDIDQPVAPVNDNDNKNVNKDDEGEIKKITMQEEVKLEGISSVPMTAVMVDTSEDESRTAASQLVLVPVAAVPVAMEPAAVPVAMEIAAAAATAAVGEDGKKSIEETKEGNAAAESSTSTSSSIDKAK